MNKYMNSKKKKSEIDKTIDQVTHYTNTRKHSMLRENVTNPEIRKHLKMIKSNIFRYEDHFCGVRLKIYWYSN